MDVLCQAKSGMGKTAVFVLSVLQQLEPVDGEVGAELLQLGAALGIRRRADHELGTHVLRDLHRHETDAGRSALYEDRLAGFEAARSDDGVVHGLQRHRQRALGQLVHRVLAAALRGEPPDAPLTLSVRTCSSSSSLSSCDICGVARSAAMREASATRAS